MLGDIRHTSRPDGDTYAYGAREAVRASLVVETFEGDRLTTRVEWPDVAAAQRYCLLFVTMPEDAP